MAKAGNREKRLFFLILRISVIAIVVCWGVSRIGQEQRWDEFKEHFKKEHFLAVFALALVIFAAGQTIIGLRWWVLLRSQSVFISFWAAVKLNFLGLFYNNFMPGSVGGDLIRAWYVTKHTPNKKFEAALCVFVDRIIGLLSTIVIAGFFYILMIFLWEQQIESSNSAQKKTSLIDSVAKYKWGIVGVIALVVIAFVGFSLHKRGREILSKLWASIRLHSIVIFSRLRDAVKTYRSKPKAIFMAFCLTACMQLTIITGFWLLGLSMGVKISVMYYYVFFTMAWVLGAVPVSIGGAGVVEALLVFLFVRNAGIDETSAWAIALCQRAVWMITSLPGAAIHLLGGHLSKDFFVDSKAPSA